MNEPVQILSGVFALATGGIVYLVKGRAWLRQAYERRLRSSVAFGEIEDFMHSFEVKYEQLTAAINGVHQSVLRQTLFGPTTSRMVHEQQLEAGREYLDLGGNGPAAAHYEVLYHDYMERSKTNDWTYERKEK